MYKTTPIQTQSFKMLQQIQKYVKYNLITKKEPHPQNFTWTITQVSVI